MYLATGTRLLRNTRSRSSPLSETEERITIGDIRSGGHCVAGARTWFGSYGLDFRKFLREGIPVEEFLATGDQLAQDVVKRKRDRQSNG